MPLTVHCLQDAPDSMTREEFAKRVSKSVDTVDRWRLGHKGKPGWLPYGTIGREVRICRDDAKVAILRQSKGGSV